MTGVPELRDRDPELRDRDPELRDRLRRLRRDKDAPPEWLRLRLARDRAADAQDAGERDCGPPGRLVESSNPSGAFAARVETFAGEHVHGDWRLDEVGAVEPCAFARFVGDGSLDAVDLLHAVYLDVETTGLSGGAGTRSFLVGLGAFEDGAFRLWQGFLRSPDEEHAMLVEVAERIRASAAIVSFFGRSFDRHRLEDKMRIFDIAPPFPPLERRPHLDLYYPCARLYRPALADGRLATMESALCGFAREDDLPGSRAPAAWFDFLAGRAHRLEAVFRHNRDDVLSLVALAAHLGRVGCERRADGRRLGGPSGARAHGLARLALARREHGAALGWIERALARPQAEPRALRFLRAGLLKRLGRRAAAAAQLHALAEDGDDEHALHALVELAKDAEHRRGDLRAATRACARARALLRRNPEGHARLRRDLDRREARLRDRFQGAEQGGR
ncbi:MAG: ribonuclease H-like domain-containing protein [Planctomycetota bacterium]|nr:ribonuclease H-like domain-containing protein [Planctomycetota bacterium]